MKPVKSACARCGRSFSLTSIEVRAYRERDWELPKTCRQCRNTTTAKSPESHLLKRA